MAYYKLRRNVFTTLVRVKDAEGGTPAHPITVYGIKSASYLAGLDAHMNEAGLLTVLLTVYGGGMPPKSTDR